GLTLPAALFELMGSPVSLGSIDVFHLMNDRAMRARGLSGNHCLFVVELAGRLDPTNLGLRLNRAVAALPELRFRLDDSLLRGLRPRWVVDSQRPVPAPEFHEA